MRVSRVVIVINPAKAHARNSRNISAAIREAREDGVGILGPAGAMHTGYGCEDAFHGAFADRTAWETLQTIAPETQDMAVALGLPMHFRNALFNAVAVLVNGRIAGFVVQVVPRRRRHSLRAAARVRVRRLNNVITAAQTSVLKDSEGGFFELAVDPDQQHPVLPTRDNVTAAAHRKLQSVLESIPQAATTPFPGFTPRADAHVRAPAKP